MKMITSKGILAIRQCAHVCRPLMMSSGNFGTCGACDGMCDCELCEVRIAGKGGKVKKGGKR